MHGKKKIPEHGRRANSRKFSALTIACLNVGLGAGPEGRDSNDEWPLTAK